MVGPPFGRVTYEMMEAASRSPARTECTGAHFERLAARTSTGLILGDSAGSSEAFAVSAFAIGSFKCATSGFASRGDDLVAATRRLGRQEGATCSDAPATAADCRRPGSDGTVNPEMALTNSSVRMRWTAAVTLCACSTSTSFGHRFNTAHVSDIRLCGTTERNLLAWFGERTGQGTVSGLPTLQWSYLRTTVTVGRSDAERPGEP